MDGERGGGKERDRYRWVREVWREGEGWGEGGGRMGGGRGKDGGRDGKREGGV